MPEMDLDKQYELAGKIQNLVMFVGLLSEEEVSALKELRQALKDQSGSISAVAGTLVDLEKAEHKVDRNAAMTKRIDAIIAISESNVELQAADAKLENAEKSRETINRMFGL